MITIWKHSLKYAAILIILSFLTLVAVGDLPYWLATFGIPIVVTSYSQPMIFFILELIISAGIFLFQARTSPKPYITGFLIFLFSFVRTLLNMHLGSIEFLLVDETIILFSYLIITPIVVYWKNHHRKTLAEIQEEKLVHQMMSNTSKPSEVYFSVGIRKFFLLNLISFGWYQVYCWYRNWSYIKIRDQSEISPFWRAILAVIYIIPFCKDLSQTCKEKNIQFNYLGFSIYLISIAIISFILNTSSFFIKGNYPYAGIFHISSLLVLFLFVFSLAMLQSVINKLNVGIERKKMTFEHYSTINAAFISIFAFIWLFNIVALLMQVRPPINIAEGLYYAGEDAKAYEIAMHEANKNNPRAQLLLGRMYQYGGPVQKDLTTAIALYQQAADQNDKDAQFLLGNIYQYGEGNIAINYQLARHWYIRSIANGSIEAMNNLAVMISKGLGGPANQEEAINLYKKASKSGDTAASYNLGLFYYRGDKSPDFQEALKWYKKSLSQDSTVYCSYHDLAIMYALGQGVEKDAEKSQNYYQKAAVNFLVSQVDIASLDVRQFQRIAESANQYSQDEYAIVTQQKITYKNNFATQQLEQQIQSACWQ